MRKPRLIVFAGQPGSGKTSRAKFQSRRLGISYYDYDTLVQSFLKEIEARYGLGQGRLSFYSQWRDASYGTLWAPVVENLRMGHNAILSAPLTREVRDPSFFSRLKDSFSLDVDVIAFYMAPDPDLHLRMLKERDSYRDGEILSDYAGYLNSHSSGEPSWDPDHGFFIQFNDLDHCDEKVSSYLDPLI